MRRSAVAGVLALLLTGCSGDPQSGSGPPAVEPSPPAPFTARDAPLPTARELAWVERLSGWMLGVQNATLGRNADYLRGCASSLVHEVPRPPSARLRPLRAAAARACDAVERGLTVRGAAADRHLARAQRTLDRVVEAIFLSAQETADRPLPVRGGSDVRTSRIEPRVGRLAAGLAKRRVEARCWSRDDWERIRRELAVYSGIDPDVQGFARVGDGTVHLAPDGCDPLVRVLYGADWPTAFGDRLELAGAAGLLAHEVRHRLGVSDEARAECWGLQHVEEVARLLGGSAEQARELAATHWEHLYDRDDETYGSPQCRDGGALDVRPGSSEWP